MLPPDLTEKYGRDAKYREWMGQMPVIHFPPSWGIIMTPPFGGAAARFQVRKGLARVSVYADFDQSLGCMDEPYWEVYPYDDDTYRCPIDDVAGLMAAISESIRQQNRATRPQEARDDE